MKSIHLQLPPPLTSLPNYLLATAAAATLAIYTSPRTPSSLAWDRLRVHSRGAAPFKNVGGGGDSCCKGGKFDCCMCATLKFLLFGRDGGGSGIGGIVV